MSKPASRHRHEDPLVDPPVKDAPPVLPAGAFRGWRLPAVIAALLAGVFALALTSVVGDSINFDETSHFIRGLSYLRTGEFHLRPEHPPLAEAWAALPVALVDYQWPPPDTPGWRRGNYWLFGRAFLFGSNDGERFIIGPRIMVILLLLATCLTIYFMGRAVFGSDAGLLALVLAALSPTLLAHGRLVTNDLPVTLFFVLTMLMFARLARSVTWPRLAAAGLSLAALSLTKFSWPLVAPALIVMAVMVIGRRQGLQVHVLRSVVGRFGCEAQGGVSLAGRVRRAVALVAIILVVSAIMWGAIWCFYGCRYAAMVDDSTHQPVTGVAQTRGADQPEKPVDWDYVLLDGSGAPITGFVMDFVRWGRDHRILPEAYLYGLAVTGRSAEARPGYLNGEYSLTGWRSYFPIAFIIKTPIAIMLLAVGGLLAVFTGRVSWRGDPVLLVGLLVFAFTYAVTTILSNFNIGHRHIVPLYPALVILAGASAGWMTVRTGRRLVAAAVLWLLCANLWIHPHYLAYFNELIGGPSRGHLYLADSNIDWGQDIKRLAKYARAHPDEAIKLAYFGSGDPRRYGFPCEMLPSFQPIGGPAGLTAGTYVISVTQLLGVYDSRFRDSFWDQDKLAAYRRWHEQVSQSPPPGESAEDRAQRLDLIRQFDVIRRARLINRLGHREPDDRIGYSLHVFRLTQDDVDSLTCP